MIKVSLWDILIFAALYGDSKKHPYMRGAPSKDDYLREYSIESDKTKGEADGERKPKRTDSASSSGRL